ncbi:MAG: LssY C-terminal domain-containing protein [Elusimicrobia bacterium]|nr:LssY C-terminal domain-containing protein [Elusimicrobiota bacterium]
MTLPGPCRASSRELADPETRAFLSRILPRLPGRNVGRFNRPGDPLNLVILGTSRQVCETLQSSGWIQIARTQWLALGRGLRHTISERRLHPSFPMNFYRLFGRFQDLNWVWHTSSFSTRHHFRLWETPFQDGKGRNLWWGSANYDMAIRWRRFCHVPEPDTSRERDFVRRSLDKSPRVDWLNLADLSQIPSQGLNDKGFPFHSDKKALVVSLS